MNRFLRALSGIFAAGLLLVPSLAQAQEVTVRLEPGLAVPMTTPQDKRFNVGADGMLKLDLPLTGFLDVVPGVGVLALSQSSDFNKTGTAWLFGGGLRLKRPHDNKGSGLSAASPWVDGDLQYVRTGDLNRFGWALGAGVAAPIVENRSAWLGPFVRYQSVFDQPRSGFDTSDAKVAIVGLSLELGPKTKPTAPPAAPPPQKVVVAPPPVVIIPEPAPTPPAEVRETVHTVVQFAVDSYKLDAKAMALLDTVASKIKSADKVSDIVVEGHASSDGPLAHNNALALNRAKAVVDYLVSKGVDRKRLTAEGFGVTRPAEPNKTKPGRVANRRAEVIVSFTVKVGS